MSKRALVYYIRRWYIISMCKISVWNDISKDILKKKNDVHWISDGTVLVNRLAKFAREKVW